jgi:hypothetical protein
MEVTGIILAILSAAKSQSGFFVRVQIFKSIGSSL